MNQENKQYILSLSYGKDNLACLGAIEKLGWPLDRIVHAEIWATDTIPADLPPMVEFKSKADKIIKERWGIKVEHVRDSRTAEELIYHRRIQGKHKGEIMGWPMVNGCELQSSIKVQPLRKIGKEGITYIGIAADEPQRFRNLSNTKKSPLVEIGWDEAYCRTWCEENDLLSPIYTTATRGGCWFCPNQQVSRLRLLRKEYPEYWALMLKWDADSPFKFKANGRTLHDYDLRFQMEDEGYLIPGDRRFTWKSVLEPEYLQLTIFACMQAEPKKPLPGT